MASITALATVLQFVHGKENKAGDQIMAPSVRALVRSSEEVLDSRVSSTSRAYTKKMATEGVRTLVKMSELYKATNLEQTVALVSYLDYLRTRRVGMHSDELVSSLTIYNIAQAYNDLITAKQIDVRQSVVLQLQSNLLRGLR